MPGTPETHSSNYQSLLREMVAADPLLLDFIFEEARDGLWILQSGDPMSQWGSPAFWSQMGYQKFPDTALPDRSSLLSAEHYQEERAWLDQSSDQHGAHYPRKTQVYRSASGSFVHFGISCRRVFGADGVPYILLGHKRLQPSAKIYESLSGSKTFYCVCTDMNGCYTYINEAYAERFGADPSNYLGKSGLDHILPVDHDRCRKAVRKCLENPGKPSNVVLRKLDTQGNRRISTWEFIAIMDDDGRPQEIQSMGIDVTPAIQNTEQYRYIFHNLRELLIKVDSAGIIQFASETAKQLLGSEEEILGKPLVSLIDPMEQRQFRQQLTHLTHSNSQPTPFIAHLQTADGQFRPIEWSFSDIPLLDEVLVLGKDILARDKLTEEIAFQASLLASVGQAVIATDLTGKVIYWNAAAEKLYGWSAAEALGQLIFELTPSQQSRSEAEAVMAQLLQGKTWSGEFMVKDKQHRSFWALVTNNPVLDDEGNLKAIIGVSQDISDQRNATMALEASERKYRFLFDHINDLICLHEPDGRYREVSSASRKLLGYEPEELIGTNPYEMFHPEDVEHIRKDSHNQVLAGKTVTRIQYRIRKKDGSYIWFDTITEPFFDGEGNLIHLMTTSRDISDLKQLDERVNLLSTLMDAVLRYTDEYISFKDTDLRIIAASEQTIDILPIERKEDLIGRTIREVLGESEIVNSLEKLEKGVLEKGKVSKQIIKRVEEDGSFSYLESKKYPMLNQEREIFGIYGVTTDVTQIMTAQENLTKLTHQLREAQQLARMGSYQLDLVNDILYPSENFIRLFGLPPKEQYHTADLHSLIHPNDREETMQLFWESLENGEDYIHEHRVVNPQTGEELVVLSQRNVTRLDEGNRIVSVNGVKLDITKQKEAEEVRQRIKVIEVQNKEMEQFAYVASHDLQEPLRTIRSFVDILLEDYQGKLGEETDYHLNTISNSAKRMSRLIRELLHYSRLGYERQLAICDLNHIVDDVLTDLQVKISEQHAQVESDQLPTLQVYETEIRQLFQNLISNAVKFHKPGIPPKIAIRCWKEADHWTFSVEDNGIGMEAEHLDRIFIIFQRLNSSRKYPGTGIGLAYCKKIVELHYGRIWVTSTPGAGSTFYFSIPDDLEKQKL